MGLRCISLGCGLDCSMLSCMHWLDDVGDQSLLCLCGSRRCTLWCGIWFSLSLSFWCWAFLDEIVCSKDERDPPSCWVDWIWNHFRNSSTLFGSLVGSYVGIDRLNTLELSSLASMCDGIGDVVSLCWFGSWLKLSLIFSSACSYYCLLLWFYFPYTTSLRLLESFLLGLV